LAEQSRRDSKQNFGVSRSGTSVRQYRKEIYNGKRSPKETGRPRDGLPNLGYNRALYR
jgi:hypothetical protein